MGKDAQIKQLVEAVSRHPGSPAFALLIDHYLDQDRVEQAIAVGKQGFAANPGYERGAVAYLAALRRKGDPRTAGEVFGQAVAYLPRSARLRLQWAMILAEAGRDHEARRFAREALNLDPLDREARALVATLGEAATPFGGGTREQTAPPVPGDEGLEREAAGLFDENEGSSPGSLSSQARAQRAAVRPRVRPIGQRTTPHQLFDLTPGPMMDDSRHVRPSDLQGSPFDITPMPLLQDQQQQRPPPTPQQPPTPPTSQAPPPVPAPPGPATTAPAPEIVLRDLPQFRSQRWKWIVPLVLLALAGVATAGFFYWRHVQDQRLARAVEAAVESTRPDRLADYERAREKLTRLLRQHAEDQRVRAALALVDAHLVSRFGGGPPLASEAHKLLRQHPAGEARIVDAQVAEALLALHEGQPERARVRATGRWHQQLAAILAAAPQHAAAMAERAATARDAAPAVLLEAAHLARWRGKKTECLALVARGLEASPGHPGLLLQQALLELDTGKRVTRSRVLALERAAGRVPRYTAQVRLLQARLLAGKGAWVAARSRAADANRLDPTDPEIGVLYGRLMLAPGGDASGALPVLKRYTGAMAHYDPKARIAQARALVLLGRPHEANELLDSISKQSLPATARHEVSGLQVRCAHLSDETKPLDSLCARPGDQITRLACVEAALQRSQLGRAQKLAAGLADSAARSYARGLRAYVEGDSAKAVKKLVQVKTTRLPDPVAPRLALAAALTRQGKPARAVKLLRQVVRQDARSVRSRLALAMALVAAGHDTEAQSLLDEVVKAKPTQPSVLARAGQAFLSLGLSSRARKLIGHGIKYNPESIPIKILAGRVAVASNRPAEARAMFVEVLKKEPDNPTALVELGRIEAASGEHPAARRHFARALQLRPRDPDLLLQLSRAYAQTGDYRNALDNGMKAIRLFRESGQDLRTLEALVELGRLFREGDRWAQDRAEELLFEATKAKSPPPAAFLEMGLLYMKRGDSNRAVWCYRQAVERDPTFAEGYLQLGQVLMRKRKWRRDAKQALTRYLKLRPKGKEAKRVRGWLKRLR